jgi:acetyl esterase/lipase
MNTLESGAGTPIGWSVPLWPNGAPGSAGRTSPEIVDPPNADHDYLKVSSIHNPSLVVCLAPKETATGAAVIVAPGGAHKWLSMDIEGYNVAEYLNGIGVSAFILKYRLGREDGSPYQIDVHPLLDAKRAVRLVRSRAGEWGVDPARVVMMGFSAGAHVTAMACGRFDAGDPASADPVERESSRPDYQALIYGGGRPEMPTYKSDTPPTFILGADDDQIVAETLPHLYLALKKAGVPAELHIYVDGGHGFGIRKPPKPLPSAATWQLRLADWLGDRGLLSRR